MNQVINIMEILGRSEQGMTRPFLCRSEEGDLYYLKGRYAGLASLCREWVAGHLAQAMGLPLPDFGIAQVDAELIEGSDRPDIQDLGAGLAFASKRLEGAREITWEEAGNFPEEIRARILLFDWWVRNEDRNLTVLGGNPNLLVTVEGTQPSQLWVFDFNLAFDESFSEASFRRNHVFGSVAGNWAAGLRQQLEGDMAQALVQLDGHFSTLPVEWLHAEGDENLPVQLDEDLVRNTLERAVREPDAFWNIP